MKSTNNCNIRPLLLRILYSFLALAVACAAIPSTAPAKSDNSSKKSLSNISAPSGPPLADTSQEDTYSAPADSQGAADTVTTYTPPKHEASAKRVKELVEERTETAKKYELSDGGFESVIGEGPVHFKDDQNRFIDIATDFVSSLETTAPFGELTSLSTKQKIKVSSLGDSSMASISDKDWSVGLSYAGVATTIPTAIGDRAYYCDVAPGIDIEYRSMWWGIKETVVLTRPTENHTFDYRLTFDGLKLKRDPKTKVYQLVNQKTDEVVLSLDDLIVSDSSFDQKKGEFATCDNANWELVDSGKGWATLRAVINESWIRDTARVWPVRIDPSVMLVAGTPWLKTDTVDSTVTSAFPSTSHPTSTELKAGYYDSSTGQNRSFLTFPMTSLTGMRIDCAKVNVSQFWRAYHTTSQVTYIAETNRAASTSDTWNSMPGVTKWAIATFTTTTDVQTVSFDLTSYMKTKLAAGQAVGGNYALYQSEDGSQNTTHWRKYYSVRNGASQPTLQIYYYPDIKPVTGLACTTQASQDWFKEVDRNADGLADNLNDRNEQGRGTVKLSWNADPNSKGYLIYGFDGNAYQVIGNTVGKSATSWTSEGSGAFPSDSDIAGYPQDTTANTYITSCSPSDDSKLTNGKRALVYPSGSATNPAGAGVVVFDGTDMYIKKWSTYPGPEQWVQYKKSGMSGDMPTYYAGQKIATTQAGTTSISGFALNGVLYDGYVTRVGGGTADIGGFVLSSIMDKAVSATITLSKPPLTCSTAMDVTAATNAVMLSTDGDYIYSAAKSSTAAQLMVRIYKADGTFVKDMTVALEGQAVYGYLDGFTTDGTNLYFYEWSGNSRMTKVSIGSGKIINQWLVSSQTADRTVSVAYDKAHNHFVMGQLDTAANIYTFRGPGLDFRDDPRPLYRKTKGATYDGNTNYYFRVASYSNNEIVPLSSSPCVTPTFENRTIRVSDASQRSFEPIGAIAGETLEGSLSEPVARLDATDLAIASSGPVAVLSRAYLGDMSYKSSYLPAGWMFGFEENVAKTTSAAIYTSPTGVQYSFAQAANGALISPNGIQATLALSAGTYTLKFPDGSLKAFDGTYGKLLYSQDRQGRRTMYSIAADKVSVTAHNGQSIQLTRLSSSGFEATYTTADGTRKFVYAVTAGTLSVSAYPSTSAELTHCYTMSGQNLTDIKAADDELAITYASASLATCHIATNAPSKRYMLTYTTTADTSVKKTTLEKGTQTAENGFTSGYEHSVYLTNLAKQVIWSSISSAADEGAFMRYNSENQLIGTQSPTVAVFTNGKASFGQKSTTTQTTEELFTYDGRGNLVNSTNKYGGYEEHFYNSNNDLIKSIDAGRGVTWYAYDSLGRLSVSENLVGVSGAKGRTEYAYDSDSNLISMKCAIRSVGAGYEWATTLYSNYAPCGLPQMLTSKEVKLSSAAASQDIIQTNEYDAFGNLVRQTMPLGTVAQATYDIAGHQKTALGADGVTTAINYDSAAHPTETFKTATGLTGKYEWTVAAYDPTGDVTSSRLLSTAGEEVSRIDFSYDTLGRETADNSSDVAGSKLQEYDAVGNVTGVSEEKVADTVFDLTQYDCLNRPISENNSKTQVQTSWHKYDDYSKTILCSHFGVLYLSTLDNAGRVIKYERLQSQANQVPVSTTKVTYGADGNQASVTEKSADTAKPVAEYTHTYDLLGREIAVQLTGQSASTTVYNTLGWVLTETDFDGVVTQYTYNERGDVLNKDCGGLVSSASYDSAGRITQSTGDDDTIIEYSYDALGRQTRELHTKADETIKDLTISYDAAGRTSKIEENVSKWARTLTYTRMGAGETAFMKTALTDQFANGIQTMRTMEGDDFKDAALKQSDGTAILQSSVVRDDLKRVTNYTVGTQSYNCGYNSKSDLSFDSALTQAGTSTYAYSPDNELVNTNYNVLSQSAAYTCNTDHSELASAMIGSSDANEYFFDVSKNLTRISDGPFAGGFTYISGKLAKSTSSDSMTYGTDALGRRTLTKGRAGLGTYIWSGQRLASVTVSKTQSVNTYDGAGQRTKKAVRDLVGKKDVTTSYVYSGLDLLSLDIVTSDSTKTLTYLYGDKSTPIGALYQSSEILAVVPFEIVSDMHGDVRAMRDSSGKTFAYFDYDAYGNILSAQVLATALISQELAQAITDAQPLRYAGYVWDSETKLYYCSQRYYDPAVGAFISKDPAKADGELSPYGYCAADPIGNVDPSGLIFTLAEAAGSYYYTGTGTPQTTQDKAFAANRAQTSANSNLSNKNSRSYQWYPAGSGHRSCAGHQFKLYKDSTYVCINCGGVFDSNGKFLRLSTGERWSQGIAGGLELVSGAAFSSGGGESLYGDGVGRIANAVSTSGGYHPSYYDDYAYKFDTTDSESKRFWLGVEMLFSASSPTPPKNHLPQL